MSTVKLINAYKLLANIEVKILKAKSERAKSEVEHSMLNEFRAIILSEVHGAEEVNAVEIPDKELLKAVKLLLDQYNHSKNCEYVHNPVAHAMFHTWKKVDGGK